MIKFRKTRGKRARVYLRRFFRRVGRGVVKPEKLSEIQIQTLEIVRKLIVNPNSDLLYAPITHICYIENANFLVKFSADSVTVTNGKFSYYVNFFQKEMSEIRNIFFRVVEKRKNEMDKRYDQTTINNLKNIVSRIDSLDV